MSDPTTVGGGAASKRWSLVQLNDWVRQNEDAFGVLTAIAATGAGTVGTFDMDVAPPPYHLVKLPPVEGTAGKAWIVNVKTDVVF